MKSKVKNRYPYACVEREDLNVWVVWDIDRTEQNRLNIKYYPQVSTRGMLGQGNSEEEAWDNAVKSIEQRECKLKSSRPVG